MLLAGQLQVVQDNGPIESPMPAMFYVKATRPIGKSWYLTMPDENTVKLIECPGGNILAQQGRVVEPKFDEQLRQAFKLLTDSDNASVFWGNFEFGCTNKEIYFQPNNADIIVLEENFVGLSEKAFQAQRKQ